MEESKPFYLSKSNWAAVLGFVVTALNAKFQWLAISPEETAAIMGALMVGMRAVTKGAVTLS
jgi:hypothetical protein